MKPDRVYENLKELAEKLDITVSEENFRNAGIRIKSGFCKVKEKKFFIIDKHASIHNKIDILASFLGDMQHEDLYVVPAVRELLNRSAISRK